MDQTFLVVGVVVLLSIVLFAVALIVKNLQGNELKEVLPYRLKKYFFNTSEQEFFRILAEQLDRDRYAVFPKVRLGDFVEVDKPKGERMKYWNYIRSKHIDFLIWDLQGSRVALAIELDGSSHNSDRAQERDAKKDRLYEAIELPLIRVRVGTDFATEVQNIKKLLK